MTDSAVVADTHTLVRHRSNASQLSTRALRMLDQAVQRGGPIYIASITRVELAYLVEWGRVATNNLLVLDTLLNVGNSALSRIIAATGLYLNAPVVTRDPHIPAAPIATRW